MDILELISLQRRFNRLALRMGPEIQTALECLSRRDLPALRTEVGRLERLLDQGIH